MKEHDDVAAVLRTVIQHFGGALVLLRRDQPDFETAARIQLLKLDGGVNRLASEQRLRNINPPSCKDDAPLPAPAHHRKRLLALRAPPQASEVQPKAATSPLFEGTEDESGEEEEEEPEEFVAEEFESEFESESESESESEWEAADDSEDEPLNQRKRRKQCALQPQPLLPPPPQQPPRPPPPPHCSQQLPQSSPPLQQPPPLQQLPRRRSQRLPPGHFLTDGT